MKRRSLTPEEQRLWRYVTRGDAPLPRRGVAEGEQVESLPRFRLRSTDQETLDDSRRNFVGQVRGRPGGGDGAIGEALSLQYNHPPYSPRRRGEGIDHHTERRFRRGEYALDAALDLHGMNRDKAHQALLRFLQEHYGRGSRCLLVITGKGREEKKGVLRELLPQWLDDARLAPLVLAVAPARPKHGGGGAYYILLRRRR